MLEAANGLEFGLSAYVFTHDSKRRRRLVDALQYGAVSVNSILTYLPEAPLGGWKDSGIGTEGGIESLEPYTITKHANPIRAIATPPVPCRRSEIRSPAS